MNKKKNKKASKSRPPVIAILGHVDHGKTTLLDKIRKTDVAAGEAAGITQHIGAYKIRLKTTRQITFIDTPGHEAFSKMRSRGAQVADLAILVIAANDGVKPQTKEAITHIKKAKIPFLVAINKIDLPEASVDMVKAQLAENKVLVEGYGGDVVCVEISAKTSKGIPQLLEMLLLLSQMQELKSQKKAKFEAIIIESLLDKYKGPLATLIIKKGILRVGDRICAENIFGKIKAMFNHQGKRVQKASPSDPIQILGFKAVPPVGSIVKIVGARSPHPSTAGTDLVSARPKDKKDKVDKGEDKRIKLILKADVAGTLEAIKANFTEEICLISQGVGNITESDVLLACSTGATIIGFNVKVSIDVKKLAQMEKVKIKTYDVIYHLLEDLQGQILKILEPTIDEEILGKAEVIAEFKIKGSHIAGCKVKEGIISKKYPLHIMRNKEKVADAKITQMQKEKQEVEKVKAGNEVGLVFKPDVDFALGDAIISYKVKS
jgi:translation initiation factor IF-2